GRGRRRGGAGGDGARPRARPLRLLLRHGGPRRGGHAPRAGRDVNRPFTRGATIRFRLGLQNLVMVGLIVGGILISLDRMATDHRRAEVDNVAGRQGMLVHKYVTEILIKSVGRPSGPAVTFDQLRSTANAIRDGGSVLAAQGNDRDIIIGPHADPVVRAKL